MIIYHLRCDKPSLSVATYNLELRSHGNVSEAWEMVRSMTPALPQEYILKAVVNATIGQAPAGTYKGTGIAPPREHLKQAQQVSPSTRSHRPCPKHSLETS